MPGSQTTPGPTGARNNAPADFAFRQVNNVGTRIDNGFAAQWLAYTLPYRRFADVLADACARIGGDVDCYSFIAVDFHHILLASLPAHSLALRPAHSRGHQFVTRYPKASDISSPPCLLRLLPAGASRRVGLAPTGKRRLVTAIALSSFPACSGTINQTPTAMATMKTGMVRKARAKDPVACCSATVAKRPQHKSDEEADEPHDAVADFTNTGREDLGGQRRARAPGPPGTRNSRRGRRSRARGWPAA